MRSATTSGTAIYPVPVINVKRCERCGTMHGPGALIRDLDCRAAEAHRAAIDAVRHSLEPRRPLASFWLAIADRHARQHHDARGICDCAAIYASQSRDETET